MVIQGQHQCCHTRRHRVQYTGLSAAEQTGVLQEQLLSVVFITQSELLTM